MKIVTYFIINYSKIFKLNNFYVNNLKKHSYLDGNRFLIIPFNYTNFMETFMKTRGLSVKNVVAIGIGSAIYVILARFTSIPTPIPNTNIELVFPFLALLAAIYGAKVGFAVGFIGHALSDFIMYGQTWWSWVLATGIFGLIIGLSRKPLDLKNGIFGFKQIIFFNIIQILANAIAWIAVAPVGDILIYSEPADKVFVQGISATISNGITIMIVGTLLLKAYAGTKIKKGSLRKED